MIYITSFIIPTIITIVILFGIHEKKEVFNIFVEGAREGLKITLNMFPSLLAIFICIGMLKNSGIIETIVKITEPITKILKIPTEITPLILIKPLSGGATLAMATDLMKKYGVDSKIGILSAIIMSSSETTFYVIALYTSSIHIKKTRKIFIPAILADLTSIIVAILITKKL